MFIFSVLEIACCMLSLENLSVRHLQMGMISYCTPYITVGYWCHYYNYTNY